MKKLSHSQIRNSKIIKSLIKFSNSNIVAKNIAITIIWIIALVPLWLYLITRMLIDPVGFWQELALLFTFTICLGWLQALLLFLGIITTINLICDNL